MDTQQFLVKKKGAITPFWERLPRFFLFPFHSRPLFYMAFLSGLTLLGLFGPWGMLVAGIVIVVAGTSYGFKVMERTTVGYFTPEENETFGNPRRASLPYKLLGVYLFWGVMITLSEAFTPGVTKFLIFFVIFATPVSTMALSVGGDFSQALNPVLWVKIIAALGKSYLALWMLQIVLWIWTDMAMPWFITPTGNGILLPLLCFSILYANLVLFNMMGYCLYQNHEALEISVKLDFDDTADGRERLKKGYVPPDVIGEEVLARVAAGDLKGALDLAYDQQRNEPENIVAHERYHRLLLLRNKPHITMTHGDRFISLLLRKGEGRKALEILRTCQKLDPEFTLESPANIFKLAKVARANGESALALKLVERFDSRYPDHPDIPAVYFMSAQIFAEDFKKYDVAQRIFKGLLKRFPDHPLTSQVSHSLRAIERLAIEQAPS